MSTNPFNTGNNNNPNDGNSSRYVPNDTTQIIRSNRPGDYVLSDTTQNIRSNRETGYVPSNTTQTIRLNRTTDCGPSNTTQTIRSNRQTDYVPSNTTQTIRSNRQTDYVPSNTTQTIRSNRQTDYVPSNTTQTICSNRQIDYIPNNTTQTIRSNQQTDCGPSNTTQTIRSNRQIDYIPNNATQTIRSNQQTDCGPSNTTQTIRSNRQIDYIPNNATQTIRSNQQTDCGPSNTTQTICSNRQTDYIPNNTTQTIRSNQQTDYVPNNTTQTLRSNNPNETLNVPNTSFFSETNSNKKSSNIRYMPGVGYFNSTGPDLAKLREQNIVISGTFCRLPPLPEYANIPLISPDPPNVSLNAQNRTGTGRINEIEQPRENLPPIQMDSPYVSAQNPNSPFLDSTANKTNQQFTAISSNINQDPNLERPISEQANPALNVQDLKPALPRYFFIDPNTGMVNQNIANNPRIPEAVPSTSHNMQSENILNRENQPVILESKEGNQEPVCSWWSQNPGQGRNNEWPLNTKTKKKTWWPQDITAGGKPLGTIPDFSKFTNPTANLVTDVDKMVFPTYPENFWTTEHNYPRKARSKSTGPVGRYKPEYDLNVFNREQLLRQESNSSNSQYLTIASEAPDFNDENAYHSTPHRRRLSEPETVYATLAWPKKDQRPNCDRRKNIRTNLNDAFVREESANLNYGFIHSTNSPILKGDEFGVNQNYQVAQLPNQPMKPSVNTKKLFRNVPAMGVNAQYLGNPNPNIERPTYRPQPAPQAAPHPGQQFHDFPQAPQDAQIPRPTNHRPPNISAPTSSRNIFRNLLNRPSGSERFFVNPNCDPTYRGPIQPVNEEENQENQPQNKASGKPSKGFFSNLLNRKSKK